MQNLDRGISRHHTGVPILKLTVPLLMYHHVAASPPGHPDPATWLSPDRFRAQVAWLHRLGYRTITLESVGEALQGKCRLPARPVVLTFDDGWLSVFTEAFPILQECRFTGTVFLVGDALGQKEMAFPESRDQSIQPLMSIDQIKTLHDNGWEIGAHSQTHSHLTRRSKDEARIDIERGRRSIEERIGLVPRVFAYPYGDFHGGLASLVENTGFAAACSTLPGRTHTPEDRFVLRRIPIPNNMGTLRFLYSLKLRPFQKGAARLRQRRESTWE